ncbi:MAG TPA: hypothetical protein PKM78_12550, partial [Anaerolineae bacterium]|nr:hypothetical protein [Anaerolineae bacterium]HNU04920.1 hypothetical protein [Anaerolineae bacterium]
MTRIVVSPSIRYACLFGPRQQVSQHSTIESNDSAAQIPPKHRLKFPLATRSRPADRSPPLASPESEVETICLKARSGLSRC